MQTLNPFVYDAGQRIIEPPDFWTSRLPQSSQANAPQLVADPGGGQAWSFDGGAWLRPVGLEVAAGLSPLDVRLSGYSYAQLREGLFDSTARLNDLQVDEIDVASIFPTFGMSLRHIADADLQGTCVQAYNDGVKDWCDTGDSERLIPQALIPANNPVAALEELKRVVRLGFKGIVFTGWPNGGDAPAADDDDAFWAICEEAEVVINLVDGGPNIVAVVDTSGPLGRPSLESLWAGRASPKGTNVTWLIFTGVLDRFPGLKLALIETGAGWLPYYMEQTDDMYRRGRWFAHAKLRLTPSEYVKRNVRATIGGDRFAIEARSEIGLNNLMWASGYPSANGTPWPGSRLAMQELLHGVPDDEAAAIAGGNAARLYGMASFTMNQT